MADSPGSPQASAGRRSSNSKRTKLKGSQLERKRKVDREAQAALRNRTKNRIAHLESLVKALGGASGKDEQLVSQLNENRENIESLVDTLTNIRKLVNSALEHAGKGVATNDSTASTTCSPPEESRALACSANEASIDCQPSMSEDVDLGLTDNDTFHDNMHCADFPLSETAELENGFTFDPMQTQLVQAPNLSLEETLVAQSLVARISSNGRHQHMGEGTLWYLVDRLMVQAIVQRSAVLNRDLENEDIPIRAVLNGWPVVEELYTLDSGWKMLRQIDQTVFPHCGALERLAILRMMRLTYESQILPNYPQQSQMPKFMLARPSEKHISHQRIVEYFVWPGLREHLVFSPHKYANNHFMDAFRNGFRFLWPHDLCDAFAKDKMTGLYTYTPRFVEGQSFLRCWTMNTDFFNNFPELRSDMSAYDAANSLTNMRLQLPYTGGVEEMSPEEGNENDGTQRLPLDYMQQCIYWRGGNLMNTASFSTQSLGVF